MLKGYIIGPYTGKTATEMIRNMRHGFKLNAMVKRLGFLTYCPWDDFLQALFLPDFDDQDWKDDSLEELLGCDFVVLADENPRWQESPGSIDELATCAIYDIPVFLESDLAELVGWQYFLEAIAEHMEEEDEEQHAIMSFGPFSSESTYTQNSQEDDGEID